MLYNTRLDQIAQIIRNLINTIEIYNKIKKFIEENMKHLLIAVMIAILIGTMQAVRIKSTFLDQLFPPTCHLHGAQLVWSRGFFQRSGTEDVKHIIDDFRARGLKQFRNDVATWGWDRAPGKEKRLQY